MAVDGSPYKNRRRGALGGWTTEQLNWFGINPAGGLFYAPDDGRGSGADGEGGDASRSAISHWIIPDEHRPGLERRIAEAGGIEAAVQIIWREAFETREGRRTAIAERDAARQEASGLQERLSAGNGVPEGGRVLTAEEAVRLDAYAALGTVEEVNSRLAQADTDAVRVLELERTENVRRAAGIAGFDPEVLADRIGELELVFSTEDDGDTVSVQEPGSDSGSVALAEYAEQHWGRYMPILRAENGRVGFSYPRQRPTSSQAGNESSPVDAYLQRKAENDAQRPNPLLPQRAAKE